jgi:ParB-like chromosome segregation protein Spo0J
MLGYEYVDVIVKDKLSDKQIRKYRLLDNKIAELAEDNMEAIKFELEELEDLELDELYQTDLEDIDFDNIDSNEDREVSDKTKEVECPSC